MKRFFKYIFVFGLLAMVGSCKKFDKLQTDPNAPAPNQADVDLYLNQVQLSFASFYSQAEDLGSQLTRMTTYFGPQYQNGYSPQTFDGIWSTAYTGVLKNVNAMIPLAESQRKFYHAGMGKVFKAYTMMTLVDLFGDVPYSEANLGNENLNPRVQSGASIYQAALVLLDSAISDFAKTPGSYPINNLYSPAIPASGSAEARGLPWIRVANTLKLKAYITTRRVDAQAGQKILALVQAGNIITTDAQEFTFRYSTTQQNPNSRHPRYNEGYRASGGATTYIGVQFMYALRFEKGLADPRTRYYFYRQTLDDPSQQQQPCAYQNPPAHYPADMPFCYLGIGYWGRDHGDNGGIPPDALLRTVWGVYPAGGKFDCSEGTSATLNEGGRGGGFSPIWMSFFTDFVRAEAALTSGTGEDARTLLRNAVQKSIARVMATPAQLSTTACAQATPSNTAINNYINVVMTDYDAAANDAERLDVVLKEFYIALWGNGLEAYNMYRRSSRPRDLQLTIQPNPGPFIRSFLYPSNFVNLNTNATQKPNWTVRTFWDNNPDALQ